MRKLVTLIILLLSAGSLSASDLAREQRIARELEESVMIGYPLRLNAGELEFFGIHTESELEQLFGGVIILHGWDANPNWQDVVFPLRSQLPESGWETLAIQLPIPAPDAGNDAYDSLVSESFPRISAAIEFFRQREVGKIVLAGHSLGARMGVEYLAANPEADIRALAAIGLPARRGNPASGTLLALQKVEQPLLDIYGSRDLESVLATASERAAAARRAGNQGYRQLEVPGADHFFNGLEEVLVMRVQAWLRKMVALESADQPEIQK